MTSNPIFSVQNRRARSWSSRPVDREVTSSLRISPVSQKYRQAAGDLADLGYPRGEAEARLGVGRALAATGDQGRAREQMELALGLFEKIESPQAAEAREALRQLPHSSASRR